MILDTNGLSAAADGDRALEPIFREAAAIAVPAIVLGEYRYGIRQSRERRRYEAWLAEAVPSYRVLAVDEETAEHYADIRSELKRRGRPIPSNDVWIAALTRQYVLPLLTRDQHFDSVSGLKRISGNGASWNPCPSHSRASYRIRRINLANPVSSSLSEPSTTDSTQKIEA